MKNPTLPAAQIIEIRNALRAGISIVRKSGDRGLMRETITRIRQLAGLLEARAKAEGRT